MTSIILGFEIHQPLRVKHLPGPSDNLNDTELIDHFFSSNGLNKFVFDRASQKCYYPTTHILLELIDTFKGQKREFKCAFNISGVWLEQCQKWQPDLLELFRQIAKTGRAEFLGSTYFHSISSLFKNKTEFVEQVKMQNQAIKDLLGVKPSVFVNTEMLYNNMIAKIVEDIGYKAIFTEGVDRILGWRSPNYVYARGPVSENDKPLNERIKVFTRNYRLSDDIGYRFSSKEWNQWPLTAEKYSIWLSSTPGDIIPIFMDYETFGEHQPESSGIFFFLKALPWKVFDWNNLDFVLPSEASQKFNALGEIDVHELSTISWADMERDTSAWLGNSMQKMIFDELERLESLVKQNGQQHLRMWRLLQQSDLLYYMCTKWWNDGDVHKYFSPFSTPHDAFINTLGGLTEIKMRLMKDLTLLNLNKERQDLQKISVSLETVKQEKPKKPKKEKSESIQSRQEPIEFILSEPMEYPNTYVNIENLIGVSDSLKRRIR
ncbi:MAG: glycoside hydrolase family 57 protein [Candidatus Aenigmatarchaeota archaeon]|nr:glycoside hydrolase family 57 protein [Candidatus Aenigmarchaeota archaeon]